MISRDLTNPRWMYLKAALLLGVGGIASTIIWLDNPRWRTVALLSLAIWGFCRAYYFAFYVIEHYIDRRFRFAGLLDFARYLLGHRRKLTSIVDRRANRS